ncbi:MAG: hypothetical protein K0Q60_3492 [Microvirga sp.]|jgi:hypothetical protein|nr:hypothetical protein [Microvirga sp.]
MTLFRSKKEDRPILLALKQSEEREEERLLLDRIGAKGFDVRFSHIRIGIDTNFGFEIMRATTYVLRNRALVENMEISGRGGITVAMAKAGEFKAAAGTAICSNEDNFCRRTGRIIALRRLAEVVGA